MAVPASQMTRGRPRALSAGFHSTSPEAALPNHPLWGSVRVAARHRCLLRPCGHRLPKRVPCPRLRARRTAARAGRFPARWLPVPSPGLSKRDWPTWRGRWLPSLGTATGLGAQPGTVPLATAQPCPAWLPTAGAAKPSQAGGGGGPHPLPDVKWRHGALHAPLNLGSQKVRDTQCVRSHQHRARQTARAHDCFRKCHPYYPHDNPEGTEAPREEVTSP